MTAWLFRSFMQSCIHANFRIFVLLISMVYRFRITYENHEDVFRDIEIRTTQTFSDLHFAIQMAIRFDNTKSATFYLSDDYWRRKQEIVTVNETDKADPKDKKKQSGQLPIKEKIIVDFVESPHQRFVYEFDPVQKWSFLIELVKILPEESSVKYPQCVKSAGKAPAQYKKKNLPPPVEEEEEKKEAPQKENKETLSQQDTEPPAYSNDPDSDDENLFSQDDSGEEDKPYE